MRISHHRGDHTGKRRKLRGRSGPKTQGTTWARLRRQVGFLAANVAYALAREDIAPTFRAGLKALLGE
jgi:hypothetical protein